VSEHRKDRKPGTSGMSLPRVATLLVTKISRTFQDHSSIFQDPVIRQQCLNIKTNSNYSGVRGKGPAASIFFVHTDHLYHCVRFPHHSLENSRTFQDLSLKFPGLSRTKPIFQDFPGPKNFTKRNPGLSRKHGNPVTHAGCIAAGMG